MLDNIDNIPLKPSEYFYLPDYQYLQVKQKLLEILKTREDYIFVFPENFNITPIFFYLLATSPDGDSKTLILSEILGYSGITCIVIKKSLLTNQTRLKLISFGKFKQLKKKTSILSDIYVPSVFAGLLKQFTTWLVIKPILN